MSNYKNCLRWDVKQLSKAMKIKPKDVKEYFTDGRRVSFILERRLAYEVIHGRLALSEGADYDLIDKEGKKYEVRSITDNGIYFCPSYMIGSGRSFNEKGFLKKLKDIEGYIIADVYGFPNILFWVIPNYTVKKWWDEGLLGKTTKISRGRALELVKELKV